jgi:hypothetical protein
MLTTSVLLLLAAADGGTWADSLDGEALGSWSPSPCNRIVVAGAGPGPLLAAKAAFQNLSGSGWCSIVLDGDVVLGDVSKLGDGDIGKKAGTLADGALVVRVFEGNPAPWALLSWVDGQGALQVSRAIPLGSTLSIRKKAVKPVASAPARAPLASTTSSPSVSTSTSTAVVVGTSMSETSATPPPAPTPQVKEEPPGPIRHEIRFDPVFVALHSSATQVGGALSYGFAFTRLFSVKVLGRLAYPVVIENPAAYGGTVASHERLRYNSTLEAGLEFVNHEWKVSPVVGVFGGVASTAFQITNGNRFEGGLRPHFTGSVGLRWHVARHFALSFDFQNLVTDSTSGSVGPCSAAELSTLSLTAVRTSSQVSLACSLTSLARDGQRVADDAFQITRGGIISWHPVLAFGASALF